ncbi:unnamed protein product [Chrysoparadoxa australica]
MLGRILCRQSLLACRVSSRCVPTLGRARHWVEHLGSSHALALPLLRPLSSVEAPAEQGKRQYEFQAETRELLNIVINSVYTDKEVFLRELISNASDAMEKLRHLRVSGEEVTDEGLPLEISITTDEAAKTLTIQDAGIGMTEGELISHLGTIARSGSKAFVNELKEKGSREKGLGVLGEIIGQFGVGFYSAFMVGSRVDVYSKSTRGGGATLWSSDGSGEFDVSAIPPEENLQRGTKVVIHLSEDCQEFATKQAVEQVIKKYSNFVTSPIKLNGEAVNTISALWTTAPSEVDPGEYKEFYRFIAKAYDDPLSTLHFRTDAPIDLRVLLFVPCFHGEKFGMGRMEPGVSLYSRKASLCCFKSADILPEYLRFMKGVVDSEDLPLSISREKPQDTALLARIGDVITRKVLRHLRDMQQKDPEKYKKEFFPEFGYFLKEGVCQDYQRQADLAQLLYFESSKNAPGELTTLDEYISRCTPEQKTIYFLHAPNRQLAEASPYYESYKAQDREVLFVYSSIDDFVMNNLKNYTGRTISTCESEGLDMDEEGKEEGGLSQEDAKDLGEWLLYILPGRLEEVVTTSRLKDSPAVINNQASGALRRMMMYVEQQNQATDMPMPKQKLEINPRHPIIKNLQVARSHHPELAELIAEQMFENALIAAGLLDDSRVMLPRLNQLMIKVLEGELGADEPKDVKLVE